MGWQNLGKTNITSIGFSAGMPGSNFVAGYASSAFEVNLSEGYKGLGNGKDFKNFMIEGSINTFGNSIRNQLGNATGSFLKWNAAANEGVGNLIRNGISNTRLLSMNQETIKNE
jgi:hypothetical protein